MQEPLDEYVGELLNQKGLPDTPEARAELIEKVNNALDDALLEALPNEQLEKLNNAADDENTPEDYIEQLLTEAGVNSDEVVDKALEKFKDEYLKGEE